MSDERRDDEIKEEEMIPAGGNADELSDESSDGLSAGQADDG